MAILMVLYNVIYCAAIAVGYEDSSVCETCYIFFFLHHRPSSLSEKSFRECFLSRFFMLHLLWLSVMQLRHYLFIGTLNPMLHRLTAGEPSLGKHIQTLHPHPP